MGILEPFSAVTALYFFSLCLTISGKTLNLKLINKKEVEIVHGWKSVRFKKDSLFSTENQNGAKGEGSHGFKRGWSQLLLNSADGLDLRGLAVGPKLLEVFELPTVTITLHDILVSTVTRILVAHKSVEK